MRAKEKKDCLFLCQFFYPEYVSSATLPYDTALKLAENGYKTGALCGFPKEYNLEKEILLKEAHKGIEIKRLKYLHVKRSGFIGRLMNYMSFFLNVFLHIPYMGQYKMIFVYSNPPVLPLAALMAKKIYGNQVIYVSYDLYPEIGIKTNKIKQNSLVCKFLQYINRRIKEDADEIVVLSQDMKEYFVTTREIEKKRIRVIPNWYDGKIIEQENQSSNPLFNAIPQDAFVISYLGNLGVCQEMNTILNAIRLLKDEKHIHFLFAGHGNKMLELKSIVEAEKLLQVKMLGFLQEKDYLDALAISDVCTVTLVRGMKGLCCPSKVYGYMMAEKPIIAVIDEEMELAQDIIREKCGYVIRQEDSFSLKNAIVELYNCSALKSDMQKNSRRLFDEKYEKEVCLEKYIKLIAERMR